jgi:4'-phosphopantetheinyl transferase
VGRSTLRTLLGRYLRTPPRSIGLRLGPNGKPLLTQSSPALHFNLAHSEGLALLALALDLEVGVDVEQIRGGPDLAAIAPRFFSPRENAQLDAVAAAGRAEAFYQCWTRKEAVIKATGEGLSRPLHSFDVTLGPGRPARLLRLEGEADAHRRWTLHELRPEPGFVGAIAAATPALSVIGWREGEPSVEQAQHLFRGL